MRTRTRLPLIALFLASGLVAANAQTATDQNADRPAPPPGPSESVAAPPVPAGGRTMMGPGSGPMAQMMRMMGDMSSGAGASAMMSSTHIEGRIAFLKTELHVTDAQTPQWSAFADALRAQSKTGCGAMSKVNPPAETSSATTHVEAMLTMMAARLDSLKAVVNAEKALYGVLADDQKAAADELIFGPSMGMGMGMRGQGI